MGWVHGPFPRGHCARYKPLIISHTSDYIKQTKGSYTLWKTAIVTVWHEKLAGVYFCGLVIFLCFAGTNF